MEVDWRAALVCAPQSIVAFKIGLTHDVWRFGKGMVCTMGGMHQAILACERFRRVSRNSYLCSRILRPKKLNEWHGNIRRD